MRSHRACSTPTNGSGRSPAASPAPSRSRGCGSPASSCARSPRSTKRIRELETELAVLVESYAPQLLAERGCGTLTAAKLIGEIAGADRFATDSKLARTSGAAPIPASSGNTTRHRLDRGGNRQLNCALHRLAVNKGNLGSRRRRLPRPQTSRRQNTQRSTPLPQTPPRPPRLATPAPPAPGTPSQHRHHSNNTPTPIIATAPYFMPCAR